MSDSIVIVGAGQAGFSAAAKLRALGYTDGLTLVGAEPVGPYQRPPLSKKYATGELSADRLALKPAEWFSEQAVELVLGVSATAIDPQNKQVTLSNGQSLPYDTLILTTGARARQLSSVQHAAVDGVMTLRSLEDADRFSSRLVAGQSMAVVGGGFIGLEAAAVAAKKGLRVTVLEQAERILQRVVGSATSDYFRALHTSYGVDIRESVTLDTLVSRNGKIESVLLKGNVALPVDTVLVGIGMQPNAELAATAGLEIDGGVVVNEYGQTSVSNIYAAGDCAVFAWRGQLTRLESVHNAISQAEHVATVIMGGTSPYDPTPWFWSDQYDTKLQIVGLNRGFAEACQRAGAKDGSFSVWYYRDDQLLSVEAVNDPIAYVVAKKVLEAGRSIPKQAVLDPMTDMKQFLTLEAGSNA